LRFFRFSRAGDISGQCRALTLFPCAGADTVWLHQTLIEALSPWEWCVQRTGSMVLSGLATSRCPCTGLVKRGAARVACASACQARVRGSTRQPDATLAADRGAGAGVQATAEGSGGMADVLLGVHGRSATSIAEHSPQAPPVHGQCGVRRTRSAHYAWRNLGISKAFWHFHR
jgi:hypothetical protein